MDSVVVGLIHGVDESKKKNNYERVLDWRSESNQLLVIEEVVQESLVPAVVLPFLTWPHPTFHQGFLQLMN